MQVLKDKIIVRPDSDRNTLSVNDKKLHLVAYENIHETRPITGTVVSAPTQTEVKYNAYIDGELVEVAYPASAIVGDKVYFHVNIVQKDQPTDPYRLGEEDLYYVPYNRVYAIERDEKITMSGHLVAIEMAKESPEKYVKSILRDDGTSVSLITNAIRHNNPEYSAQVGVVRYVDALPDGWEVNPGDTVLFVAGGDISFESIGKDMAQIRALDIVATGDMVIQGHFALIQDDPAPRIEEGTQATLHKSGLYIPYEEKESGVATGTVVSVGPLCDLVPGERVFYDRASGGIEIDGTNYRVCIPASDIFGVIE